MIRPVFLELRSGKVRFDEEDAKKEAETELDWEEERTEGAGIVSAPGGGGGGGGSSELRRRREEEAARKAVIITWYRRCRGGCWAVISLKDPGLRGALLKRGSEVSIQGVKVHLRPHINKKTGLEVETDIFASWSFRIGQNSRKVRATVSGSATSSRAGRRG